MHLALILATRLLGPFPYVWRPATKVVRLPAILAQFGGAKVFAPDALVDSEDERTDDSEDERTVDPTRTSIGTINNVDALIDELLYQPDDVSRVPVMSKYLNILFEERFHEAMQNRIEEASSDTEEEELGKLSEFVVNFLEELTEVYEKMEPELQERQRKAAEEAKRKSILEKEEAKRAEERKAKRPTRDEMSAKLTAAAKKSGKPIRRQIRAEVGQTRPTLYSMPTDMDPRIDLQRSENRFILECLLDAAHDGMDELEGEMRKWAQQDKITTSFIDHLNWEVKEAVKQKNRNILAILEVVVQRIAVFCEAGDSAVQLFTNLLLNPYTQGRAIDMRGHLETADEAFKTRFLEVLFETQQTLEQEVKDGKSSSQDLLEKVRTLATEAKEYYKEDIDSVIEA